MNFPDPMSLQPIDRLSDPRVAVDHPMLIYTTDHRRPLRSRARDLSVGGVCAATASPFAFTSVERVVLKLPSGRLSLQAEGLWQQHVPGDDRPFTGISFTNLDSKSLYTLSHTLFESGQKLGSFLFERTGLWELGLADCVQVAQNNTRYRDIPAGQCIYRQDTSPNFGNAIFIVKRGEVSLRARVRGDTDITLDQLDAGEIFGEAAFLAGTLHIESAVAEGKVTLLQIGIGTYRYLRTTQPGLAHQLGQVLIRLSATRLRNMLCRVAERVTAEPRRSPEALRLLGVR